MGWERRHGDRLYLYRNRRVNGRRVKEYLARDGPGGALLAHQLRVNQERAAAERERRRQEGKSIRDRADALHQAVAEANDVLRAVVEGTLTALGFHRHHRGDWRMKRLHQTASAAAAEVTPLIHVMPPANDPETRELFAAARAGNATALGKVKAMMTTGRGVEAIGDLGRLASERLILATAGNDPVWAAAITARVDALRRQLSGGNPSVLEELLVRRVVNGWVAVHALELELSVRPPRDVRVREYLEKSLGRAQKRMTSAVTDLARVRRLQTPTVQAKLRFNLSPDKTPTPPKLNIAPVAEEK